MSTYSTQLTEFFGVFLAYHEIMEKSCLFAKCPFHWDDKNHILRLDHKFRQHYNFWIKNGITLIFIFTPTSLILLRYFVKKLGFLDPFEDNVPPIVVTLYVIAALLVISLSVLIMPLVVMGDKFVFGEIQYAFEVFCDLGKCKL